MLTKVVLPQMGEGVTDATITQWLKEEGEEIEEYEPLVEVNTDKVDTEVPSPVSGTVLKILCGEDETVPVNTILLAMEGDPNAAPAYWVLALGTGGSLLAPADDWP